MPKVWIIIYNDYGQKNVHSVYSVEESAEAMLKELNKGKDTYRYFYIREMRVNE